MMALPLELDLVPLELDFTVTELLLRVMVAELELELVCALLEPGAAELLDLTCVPPEDAPELPPATDVPPELELELEPGVVADELLMAAPEELSAVSGPAPLSSPPQEVIAKAAQSAAGIRNSFLIAKPLIQRQIYF